jgi:DNA-binding winged helix-turn-helix (wHTH) protein
MHPEPRRTPRNSGSILKRCAHKPDNAYVRHDSSRLRDVHATRDMSRSYNFLGTGSVSAIVVDVGTRLVRRKGIELHLSPKAFDLLVVLVRNQPNAVGHEDLRAALWPDAHVSETSLSVLVTQLRKALGDASAEGGLIRTLHRVGYAFIGDAVISEPTGLNATPACRVIWRGKSIEVPPGESVIGRDRGSAVCIDADSVSRHHAKLIVTGRGASIEDLGSKNGTWISGERVHGNVTLTDGVSIRLGSETVRFEMPDVDRPTKTASS